MNNLYPKRKGRSRDIIINSNGINLNLNWHSKRITKKSLENKEYKWGHSIHRGLFIRMKLTLALESKTLKPLSFLINEANVKGAKTFADQISALAIEFN